MRATSEIGGRLVGSLCQHWAAAAQACSYDRFIGENLGSISGRSSRRETALITVQGCSYLANGIRPLRTWGSQVRFAQSIQGGNHYSPRQPSFQTNKRHFYKSLDYPCPTARELANEGSRRFVRRWPYSMTLAC